MAEAIQLKTRIWPTRGTKPTEGDEVYSGGVQPIADYDNWANWAITTDIHNLNDELGGFQNKVLNADGTAVDNDALEDDTISIGTGGYLTGGDTVALGGGINISTNKSALESDFLALDGSNKMGAPLDVGRHKVTGVSDKIEFTSASGSGLDFTAGDSDGNHVLWRADDGTDTDPIEYSAQTDSRSGVAYRVYNATANDDLLTVGTEGNVRAPIGKVYAGKGLRTDGPAAIDGETTIFDDLVVSQDGTEVQPFYGTSGGTTATIHETNDDQIAQLSVQGDQQGTGYIYAGQNSAYGGGFTYNGDDNPNMPMASDHLSIFRRSGGTDEQLLHWFHNGGNAIFETGVDVRGGDVNIPNGGLDVSGGYTDVNSLGASGRIRSNADVVADSDVRAGGMVDSPMFNIGGSSGERFTLSRGYAGSNNERYDFDVRDESDSVAEGGMRWRRFDANGYNNTWMKMHGNVVEMPDGEVYMHNNVGIGGVTNPQADLHVATEAIIEEAQLGVGTTNFNPNSNITVRSTGPEIYLGDDDASGHGQSVILKNNAQHTYLMNAGEDFGLELDFQNNEVWIHEGGSRQTRLHP